MSLAIVEKRTFATSVVLCVVTKMIPDARLMPDVYQLLEFLTGGAVPTSKLAAAMHEANRFLVFRQPALLEGWVPGVHSREALNEWVSRKVAEVGETLPVVRN